ncbi:hypothetical protein [Thermobacillus composti]|jgi:hypothetical protein|nr:hypothetical protein [Thermobacillus composti]
MGKRIAFIMESSTRQPEPMKACDFYRSHKSRWINSVVEYMEVRDFPKEDIFFLSFHRLRIIGYEEVVAPYPVSRWHPRKSQCEAFARKILEHVLKYPEIPFVELHTGRPIADSLKPLFDEHGVPYRVFGDGVPLAQKPLWYEGLIEEERNIRRLRDFQHERWSIIAGIHHRTPQEASRIVDEVGPKAHQYGVESTIEGLKAQLGAWRQALKDARRAWKEFAESLREEDTTGELEQFLSRKESLDALFTDLSKYEEVKRKYGRTIAKFTCYLIKQSYVQQKENRVGEALLRLQIELLK